MKKRIVNFLMTAFSLACGMLISSTVGAEKTGNDLSYDSYIQSDHPLKCFYGYIAEKTGDHHSAIRIFEECIEHKNDVYSMIWLAQIYETGVGVPQDLEAATALMRRGAHLDDEAGYASLARYHYGVSLFEGKGTKVNKEEAIYWLNRAADEGIKDASDYLEAIR